ncbi:DUF982 domain-containing protein [Mesorhizobium sp. Pch-S]|uniref:DUF982 domain-containing protein n=1 Tax=Mesorhizobium sp. Pch-S TaxID=2082387 RepID=UPI001012142F|nr:DUF982 domain-containing protein [Mesorhizobium sp. Pch-S]QAZ45935.1 DUF982 domain-containing protein [Mesorhizobium sp. Pch-S]
MSDKTFAGPVYVKTAEGLVEEIVRLEDALDFLYDWPEDNRSTIHSTAVDACEGAYDEGRPIQAAKNAFVGFATSVGILTEAPSLRPRLTLMADDGVPA